MNIQGIQPTMTAPVQAQSTSSSSSTGSSGSSSTSSSDMESTFLNLLVTELQNQDPTSPVDPTEMVSQMVSLNELDQLISINQTLTNMSTTASSGSGSTPSSDIAKVTTPARQMQFQAQPASTSAPSNWPPMQSPSKSTVVPAAPGLMNLYGSFGLPVAKSIYNQTGAR